MGDCGEEDGDDGDELASKSLSSSLWFDGDDDGVVLLLLLLLMWSL